MGSPANNRQDGAEPAVTDNGNYIVDVHFPSPPPHGGGAGIGLRGGGGSGVVDPAVVAAELRSVVGVVEHCLFCDMAAEAVVASAGPRGVYTLRAARGGAVRPDV